MSSFIELAATFKECLLPIIPPGATLSEQSSLHPNTLGKIPGIYHQRGKFWTGFPKWSEHITKKSDLQKWSLWPAANIGINLRNHVAIDIDIDDEELIAHILQILEDRLPPTMVREREGSPRVMFFYYCPDNDLPAVQRVVFEGKGMIEILAKGRQAVLEGMHPSGQQQTLVGNLKRIKAEEIEDAVDAIFYAFPEAGRKISQPHHKGRPSVWREKGSRSYRTIVETIAAWREMSGRHDALRDLIWGMIADSRTKEHTQIDAENAMRQVPPDLRDGTWDTYFNSIGRMIDGAETKLKSDKVDFSNYKTHSENFAEFPAPIGRLGELTKSVLRASPHPNLIVATSTALGLVAGITGRRFNAMGVGLNIYISLLMPSGMGKDIINKFIGRTLLSQFPLKESNAFLGNQRYTGAKALMDLLHKKRSCISVFTEAGIMFSSTLGDATGLQRAVLDLFTKSGADDYSLTEGYSSKSDDIKSMRAPAFSMINESTPDAFIKAMKKRDAESTGELARMLLFNIGSKKSDFNTEIEYGLTPDVQATLGELIDFCITTQEEDDPMAVNLSFESPQQLLEMNNHFTDRYNELIDYDPFTAVMYSRSWIKMIKLAALSAVIDYDDSNYENCVVGSKHIDWAIQVLEYEMSVLKIYMKATSESPIDTVAKQVVVPRVIRLLHDEVPQKARLPKKMKEDQVFSWSALMKLCANNRLLGEIGDASQKSAYPKTGLEKVLAYLIETRMICELPEGSHGYHVKQGTRVFKCLADLEALIEA